MGRDNDMNMVGQVIIEISYYYLFDCLFIRSLDWTVVMDLLQEGNICFTRGLRLSL